MKFRFVHFKFLSFLLRYPDFKKEDIQFKNKFPMPGGAL